MNLNFLNFLSNNFLKNEEDAQTLRELEAKNNSIGFDEDQTNWSAAAGGWGSRSGDSVNPDQQSILFDEVFESKKQRIAFYRSMFNYPLVKKAILVMVNEMCKPNADNEVATLNITKAFADQFNKTEYKSLKKEFDYVINCVFGGSSKIRNLVKRWLVDGQQFIENCSNDDGSKLVGIKVLPPYCSLVVYEEGVATGYVQDPRMIDLQATGEIKRFTLDQVSYSDYGQWGTNRNDVRGHLDAAIRPLNQLRAIEDALTVTRINRAPERRLWNVFIGRANDAKATAMVNDVKNKYRKTLTINPDTGVIESSKNVQSFTEDIFVGKTDQGQGTTVEPIKSSTEFNGQMDDVKMFQQQVMDALLFPAQRWANPEGGTQASLSPEQEINEITFQEMCRELAQKYCDEIIKHTFLVHIKMAGFKKKYLDPALYNITLNGANNFEKIRQIAVWEKMGGLLSQLQTMLPSLANAKADSEEPKPLISKQYMYSSILNMSDSDILKNQQWIQEESEALLDAAKAAKDEAAPEDEDEDLSGEDDDIGF